MLNVSGKFLKVWKVKVNEKSVMVNLGSSNKQQDGSYVNSSWNAMFVGKALAGAKSLVVGDVINTTSAIIENVYDKEKKVTYLILKVFEFTKQNEEVKEVKEKKSYDEDEFPF